MVITPLSWWRP